MASSADRSARLQAKAQARREMPQGNRPMIAINSRGAQAVLAAGQASRARGGGNSGGSRFGPAARPANDRTSRSLERAAQQGPGLRSASTGRPGSALRIFGSPQDAVPPSPSVTGAAFSFNAAGGGGGGGAFPPHGARAQDDAQHARRHNVRATARAQAGYDPTARPTGASVPRDGGRSPRGERSAVGEAPPERDTYTSSDEDEEQRSASAAEQHGMIGTANIVFWLPYARRPTGLPPRRGSRLVGGGVRPPEAKLRILVKSAVGLRNVQLIGKMDPYVKVWTSHTARGRHCETMPHTNAHTAAIWNETFVFPVLRQLRKQVLVLEVRRGARNMYKH